MTEMNLNEMIKEFRKYVIFIIGGGISLLINLAVTYTFTEYAGLWHMLSFTIALFVEIIFLFVYHTYITFKTNGRFIKFTMVILFISFLNWIGVYIVSVIIKINYIISIILVAFIISIMNYYMNNILVFKKDRL